MSSGTISNAMRRRVFAEEGLVCAICGRPGYEVKHRNSQPSYHTAVDGIYLGIDHIVPRSRGGTNERKNLRVLCTYCNSKKGARLTGEIDWSWVEKLHGFQDGAGI